MKRFRVVILFAITLALLAGILFWSRGTTRKGAATPAACLDNYYEACRSGDGEQYLNCLAESYRSRVDPHAFETARQDARNIKNWVQFEGPAEEGSSRWVDVEEVRAADVRRLRYHLQQAGRGWVIAAIDPPREISASPRYGTPVGDDP